MYNTAYGYAPFTPAARAYSLAPFRAGMVGADPTTPPTFMQQVTDWGNKVQVANVPNKYWAGGALALGVLWYAHKKRMF